ncbi:MAG TPA: Stp1/IreP family PP2C-type Ser/Thr phosphatase, partial [Ktedonobacteraceae bacterium]|nr:Stp1/IreP family PP2C-type Ser/Thr phosphatase [Ktedonobacteraceae bacterium]
KTGWDGGISAYYAGNYQKAHDAFKPILKTTAQFAAPQTFDALAVSKLGPGTKADDGTGSRNNGNSQFLLILLGAGLLVLILLLVLVTILVGRARRRRRELARFAAEQQEAQRQAEEEVQRQRLQAPPAPSGEVPCPNCRQPVRLTDTICVHCHYPLSPTASGLGLRLTGTSPLPVPGAAPAPAQGAVPLSAMPTRPPMPISEQPTIQFPPSPAAVSSAEKTIKRKKPTKMSQDASDQGQMRGLKLAVATRSDPGLKRKHKPNEDSLFAMQGARKQQPFGLFVVADGMGGHANGQDASRLAIQTMINYMLPKMSNDSIEEELFRDMLGDGVQQANQAVHQRNLEAHGDMGTTMTTALVVGSTAYVANVGDSRTYLYREGQGLSKVTQDHSVVASLVEAGIIKPDDIYTHPKRNQIYRSLGEKPQVEVDTFKVELQPGDKLLLCSDGLWDMVRDPLIQQVMSKPSEDPNKTGQELIKAALQGGGEDNVSVIVIQLSETDQQISVSNFQLLAKPETVTVPSIPQLQ